MSFNPGDKVLVKRGYTTYVGTVQEPGTSFGYVVKDGHGTSWTIDKDFLTRLPSDTPLLVLGDIAMVRGGSLYPGRHGNISSPVFRGPTFGYSMWLIGTGEQVWVPASVLVPVVTGGVS